jgi:DNA-binding response OmpR family regulator
MLPPMTRDTARPHVLVVDDEPDVCETVVDVLGDCEVDIAHSFDEARGRLAGQSYDVVILDIMGVNGHELLEMYGQAVPCIMLTAHALTAEAFERSVEGQARLFLPKHEMARLRECVDRVLRTDKPQWGWLRRMFDMPRTFGPEFMAVNFLKHYQTQDDEADDA